VPPTYPVPAIRVSSFPFSIVLGTPIPSENSEPTASSFISPIAVHTSSKGIYVADLYDERVLFFASPIKSYSNATAVYGQKDFTSLNSEALDEPVSLATDPENSLYVSDQVKNSVEKFLYTSIDQSHSSFVYSDASIGKTFVPSMGSDAPIGTSTKYASTKYRSLLSPKQLAVDSRTYALYVADYGNNRVLRFPGGPRAAIGPNGVWGQKDYIDTSCKDSSTSTCLKSPSGLALDCYGGLWVATKVGTTYEIYWFKKGNLYSEFAIRAPVENPSDWDDIWSLSWDADCRHMAVSTGFRQSVYVLEMQFSEEGIPEAPMSTIVFGSRDQSFEGDGRSSVMTESMGYIYSASWDPLEEGVLWVTDYFNHRVVNVKVFGETTEGNANSQQTNNNNYNDEESTSEDEGQDYDYNNNDNNEEGSNNAQNENDEDPPARRERKDGRQKRREHFKRLM